MCCCIVFEYDSDNTGDQCNENSKAKIHYHNSVKNLFERAHLEDVLAEVHDQLGFCASVNNHGNNMT